MNSFSKNRTTFLFVLLCLLGAGYSLFEWITFKNAPDENAASELATEAVTIASDNFDRFVFDFTSRSTSVTENIKSALESGSNLENVFTENIDKDYFWGSLVFKDKQKHIWSGFVPNGYPDKVLDVDEPLHVSINTENNVTYLYSLIPFFVEEQDSVIRYDVYNRAKLSQDNILTLGSNLELSPVQLFSSPEKYPVRFDFNEFTSQKTLASSVISTASSDSLGQIYALEEGFNEFVAYTNEKTGIWRAFFLVCFLLLVGALAFSFSKSIEGWTSLVIPISAYTCIWLLIKTLYPLLNIQVFNLALLSNLHIVNYTVNALYTLLVAITATSYLVSEEKTKLFSESSKFIATGIILSASSGATFYTFLLNTSSVIIHSDVRVLDLELIPSLTTLVFYLCSSATFISLFVLFITLNWFFLKNAPKQFWYFIVGIIAGITGFTLIGAFTFASGADLSWALAISLLSFSLVLIFSIYLVKKPPAFLRSSKLRLLIFISYLSVCFIYIAFVSGNTVRQNQRMLEAAADFSVDEELEIQNITINLLRALSDELSTNPSVAFEDASFDRFLADYIKPEWLRYTISVQVIDIDGTRFTDYTTSLSPPQWSTAFRIAELEIPFEDEQIRRSNLRPVLRRRPINTINANYSSFIRGWIPVFENSTSEKRIGWVLCSVYEELPQLDRPLRTVISSQKYDNWGDTFLATEYEKGSSVRSLMEGIPLEIPEPAILSETVISKVASDSIFATSLMYGSAEIKELYVKKGEGNIVRIATKKVGLTQHIFSFLRLFFVLVILGISVMLFFSWSTHWKIFGQSRRFKDRLIDRFILASMVCLLTLVGASYYVLTIQNQNDVEDQLFNKLENLSSSLESELSNAATNPSDLQRITSLLDVDASLYIDGIISTSTTSQIFTQHLLPSVIPWEVYQRITTFQSDHELIIAQFDDQEMVIGFQPWFDESNQVVGIAAVPTFLKAPKFYERLLSTTSYMLAFYTVIFGMLMMVIGFISTQLTSPLEEIRNALKHISDGDLNVKLPVKSEDEIGTLTKAYNQMAGRLKTTQEELAKSEREAAWKEMAQQIAHEIKNPLTPMKLNLQHLERQLGATETDLESVKPKVSKIAASMIEQIDSLNKIASDFSKFAKPIEHEFSRIDINALTHSVVEMYSTDDSYSLITDFSKKELFIMGAKEELRRVLVNLIKNAKEALAENGKITVCTFSDSDEANAFVTVTDNGEGISSEDQDRIFVPNFSTKSSGTGLGLAITKKIVEEHNGEISFISTIGQGTSFTIRIPLSNKVAK